MTNHPVPPSERVGFLRRVAVMFYDSLLLIAVLFAASFPVVASLQITIDSPLYPAHIAYIHAVAFLYYGWFWTNGRQSLGMKTWGVRIETFHGGTVGWREALIRYVGALLSWLPLGLGFLWSIADPQKLAWHDRLSRTRLVHETRRPAAGESVDAPQGGKTEAEKDEQRQGGAEKRG